MTSQIKMLDKKTFQKDLDEMLGEIIQKDLDEMNKRIDDITIHNEELGEDDGEYDVSFMEREKMIDMKMYMEKILNLITDHVKVNL